MTQGVPMCSNLRKSISHTLSMTEKYLDMPGQYNQKNLIVEGGS
jgi:hypothetical protein